MTLRLTGVAIAVVFGLGCKKEPPPPTPSAPLAQALKQAGQAADQAAKSGDPAALAKAMQMLGGQGAAGPHVEPVNFRELKALLPEELPGFTRTSATGEKAGAMGMVVSEAKGEYNAEGGAHIAVKLLDVGSLAGPLALGLAGWASVEIDRETETGYEKSTVLGGNKAFEKYDTRSKHGELNVLVGNRFIVELHGSNVKIDDLKSAAGKLDLGKLASLK
jgi:hypothetical protein